MYYSRGVVCTFQSRVYASFPKELDVEWKGKEVTKELIEYAGGACDPLSLAARSAIARTLLKEPAGGYSNENGPNPVRRSKSHPSGLAC